MFIVSLIVIVFMVAVDQILKYLVVQNIDLNEIIEVVKIGSTKVFSLTNIRNSGAAWSMMSGHTWFLIALPIIIIIMGFVYLYRIRNKSKLELFSLAVLISGGIGNLIDRIRFKEVVDFIKFEPINFPIFNFADICVVIGGIIFCFCFIFKDGSKSKKTGRKNAKS